MNFRIGNSNAGNSGEGIKTIFHGARFPGENQLLYIDIYVSLIKVDLCLPS